MFAGDPIMCDDKSTAIIWYIGIKTYITAFALLASLLTFIKFTQVVELKETITTGILGGVLSIMLLTHTLLGHQQT